MKSCNGYWSDHEWAVYLGVSERTVRNYFREGIILGAEQNDAGEWWAASTGMSRYRTFQNMAVHRRWKRDEFGDFEDPRLSETLKQAFGPLYAARRKRILRRAKMWRIASAHSRAMRQEAFEMKKLDDLEESARWMLSANSRLKQLHELKMGLLKDYLPSPSSIAFIKPFTV